MSPTEPTPERHYVRLDWSLPRDELEEQIMDWLVEVLGPPEIEDVPGYPR